MHAAGSVRYARSGLHDWHGGACNAHNYFIMFIEHDGYFYFVTFVEHDAYSYLVKFVEHDYDIYAEKNSS